MREKYLPIGTVVMLNNGTKRLMIIGFCVKPIEKDEIYDYVGCLYPEGIISSNHYALFNHEQIKEVYAYGYEDEEEQKFKEYLNETVKNTNDNAEIISE